jgi:hypothetical protein
MFRGAAVFFEMPWFSLVVYLLKHAVLRVHDVEITSMCVGNCTVFPTSIVSTVLTTQHTIHDHDHCILFVASCHALHALLEPDLHVFGLSCPVMLRVIQTIAGAMYRQTLGTQSTIRHTF